MSHLKKILNIDSFSSVVGCAQPTENKVIASQHHRPTTIKTFKAKVSGLDLGNLIEKFPRIFHNLNYGEDEILAIEYEQLEQIEI